MANLNTTYMGIELSSPLIVGACTISKMVDNIKKAEDNGAGALVIKSLYQEQIEMEAQELEEALNYGSNIYAESLSFFPQMEHSGPREHIMWVEKTRKAVNFPLIGSLNATSKGNWVEYAKLLEEAGCNALELNIYSVETDMNKSSADIENQAIDTISSVVSEVKIPVSLKISPFYTSVANFAKKAVEAGVKGLVLFNRFYQPTIDIDTQSPLVNLELSTSEESRLPLRWVAILSDKVGADICASTGIQNGKDAVKQLLAGACAVQCVSTLYKNGLSQIGVINKEIEAWMNNKGYANISDFKGKVNQANVDDPKTFERAQYMKLLMSRD
ncbi:MAG: dihydroorotate dehydrogenase-like protein [Armatimonadota bacterium]